MALRSSAAAPSSLCDAGVLSAQVDPLGFKMGMSCEGSDDKQLALNIMHWLSGALHEPRLPMDAS